MNNEESLLSPASNDTVSTTGTPLPEQTKQAVRCVPRGISMLNLIHQWQPMGLRVLIDLPFVGNDSDVLFFIRNGPFIPRWDKDYKDSSPDKADPPLPTQPGNLRQYAWNNMKNLWLGKTFDSVDYGKSGVHFTQYDYPPFLSTLAMAFRKWRGDMQYRFRVVSGFTTSGYIIIAPFKNLLSPIACYDEYKNHPAIVRQDASYREAMMNSYVMGDTSMYRHAEITCPFEYPVPYYDQYQWMARRVSPNSNCTTDLLKGEDPNNIGFIQTMEPHGDNFIGYMLRGAIGTGQTGSQISIEMEYRAVEGFQFADPGLPPYGFTRPYSTMASLTSTEPYDKIKTVPSHDYTSDGWGKISKNAQSGN